MQDLPYLHHIREGRLPVLTARILDGWFNEVEGFEIRLHWLPSSQLLGQASPPWVDPFDEIPF